MRKLYGCMKRPPVLVLIMLIAAGCTGHKGLTIKTLEQPAVSYSGQADLLPTGMTEFLVSSGDVYNIEVVPLQKNDSVFLLDRGNVVGVSFFFDGGYYRLMPGDVVGVDFVTDSELNFEASIRLDGRLTVPKVGEIEAAGKTVPELTQAISRKYSNRIKEVQLTVSLLSTNMNLIEVMNGEYAVLPDGSITLPVLGSFNASGRSPSELSEDISEACRKKYHNNFRASVIPVNFFPEHFSDFSRTMTVDPVGNVMLPEVGIISAAGLDLPAFKNRVKEKLQDVFVTPLDVSLTFISSSNMVVYIGGDVVSPGQYPISGNMTILKAIMMAGGTGPGGSLDEVVLIHTAKNGDLTVYRTNLTEVLEDGAAVQDIALAPRDVIYIPKTGVAEANMFVDQYITRMLPFTPTVGYQYSYNKNPDLKLR